MFLENKYTNIYYTIVNRAKSQPRIKGKDIYFESHHIIPKSLGGDNSNNNKVLLTFKEHYICHRLLPKMVSKKEHVTKMNYALYVLNKASDGQLRELSHHQRMICLEANRKASSTRNHKPNLGNKHSEKTKQILREKPSGRKHTEETIEKIKENNMRTNKSRGEKTRKALTGKHKTKEHKKRISEAIKRKHAERKMVAEVGFEPTTSSV
jgi:hypothetical protein